MKAKQRYPVKGDQDTLSSNVNLGEELPDEDISVRRGLSDDLVWVQNQVIIITWFETN